MKFIINLLLLMKIKTALCAPIVVSYLKSSKEAIWIKETLIQSYSIPPEFIKLNYLPGQKCKGLTEVHYWHLCVDGEGEMSEVYADDFFKLNILPSFKKENG